MISAHPKLNRSLDSYDIVTKVSSPYNQAETLHQWNWYLITKAHFSTKTGVDVEGKT